MKAKIQLELFADNDELTILRKELNELYRQQSKLEKALRSKHHLLAKLCLELKEENDVLRRRLDRLEKQSCPQTQDQDLLERLFKEAYLPSI